MIRWYDYVRVGFMWSVLFVGVAFATAALEIAAMGVACRTVGWACQTVIYSW